MSGLFSPNVYTNVPSAFNGAYNQIGSNLGGLLNGSAFPYQQQSVFGFTPFQNSAFGMGYQTANNSNYLAPYQSGLNALNSGVSAIQSQLSKPITTETWGPDAYKKYVDPNLNDQVNTTLSNLQTDTFDPQTQGLRASQAAAGAFGDRSQLALDQQQKNQSMVKAQTEAQLRGQAYQNAMSAFQSDQARNLQAQGLTSQQAISGANSLASGANTFGGLGNNQLGAAWGNVNNLNSLGGQQQQFGQSIANAGNANAYQSAMGPYNLNAWGANALKAATPQVTYGPSDAQNGLAAAGGIGSLLFGGGNGSSGGGLLGGLGNFFGSLFADGGAVGGDDGGDESDAQNAGAFPSQGFNLDAVQKAIGQGIGALNTPVAQPSAWTFLAHMADSPFLGTAIGKATDAVAQQRALANQQMLQRAEGLPKLAQEGMALNMQKNLLDKFQTPQTGEDSSNSVDAAIKRAQQLRANGSILTQFGMSNPQLAKQGLSMIQAADDLDPRVQTRKAWTAQGATVVDVAPTKDNRLGLAIQLPDGADIAEARKAFAGKGIFLSNGMFVNGSGVSIAQAEQAGATAGADANARLPSELTKIGATGGESRKTEVAKQAVTPHDVSYTDKNGNVITATTSALNAATGNQGAPGMPKMGFNFNAPGMTGGAPNAQPTGQAPAQPSTQPPSGDSGAGIPIVKDARDLTMIEPGAQYMDAASGKMLTKPVSQENQSTGADDQFARGKWVDPNLPSLPAAGPGKVTLNPADQKDMESTPETLAKIGQQGAVAAKLATSAQRAVQLVSRMNTGITGDLRAQVNAYLKDANLPLLYKDLAPGDKQELDKIASQIMLSTLKEAAPSGRPLFSEGQAANAMKPDANLDRSAILGILSSVAAGANQEAAMPKAATAYARDNGNRLRGFQSMFEERNPYQNYYDGARQMISQKLGLNPDGTTPKANAQTFTGIPDDAILHLKKNPNLKALFDAKYGAGAANKALGQ